MSQPQLHDIATITFTVFGKLVGKNDAYRDRYGKADVVGKDGVARKQTVRLPGRGAKTREAIKYVALVYAAAYGARFRCPAWPTNPWKAARVRLEAQQYDDKHDSDAKCLLVQDGLRGVLYGDDNVVGWGSNDPDGPIMDGKGARVVITATLRALRTDEWAEYLARNEERVILNKNRRRNGLKNLPKLPTPAVPEYC